MKNCIQLRIWGKYALFTDPVTRIGGEKCSYHVPTYEALKGVLKSIYWKPTIIWVIDRVRIVNRIRTQSKGTKPLNYTSGEPGLAIYTYLSNVEYQVCAHFEFNMHRPDLAADRIEGKHFEIARRSLERGGRQDVFLGTRECHAYVEPCTFGEGEGAYDELDELAFGMMFHGFDYPDETGKPELHSRFFCPVMKQGVIDFPTPEQCALKRFIRPMTMKAFSSGTNVKFAEGEIDNGLV